MTDEAANKTKTPGIITTNKDNPQPVQVVINTPQKVEEVTTEKIIEKEVEVKKPVSETEIKSYQTLDSNYQTVKVRDQVNSERLFNINVPSTAIRKYLIEFENHTYGASKELDTYVRRDEKHFLGRYFAVNNDQKEQALGFAIPGITNVVPSYQTAPTVIGDVDIPDVWSGVSKEPSSEFRVASSVESQVARTMGTWMNPQWAMTTLRQYGGSLCRDEGYVINIKARETKDSKLSYVTTSGQDYINIAFDKTASRTINDPFRFAPYREYSRELKYLITWLHNTGSQSPLCYNPTMEQLKLILYTLAGTTGYTWVEGLNQMVNGKYIIDSRNGPMLAINTQATHESGQDNRLIWCSLAQFIEIQQLHLDPFQNDDINYGDYQWYYVPVKMDWFRSPDHGRVLSYILSLLPYPLCTYEYPAGYATWNVRLDQAKMNINAFNVYLEPLASKIRIDGHPNICFVVVDWDNEWTCDPNQPEYYAEEQGGGYMQLAFNGNRYSIPNYHFGPSAIPDQYDLDLGRCGMDFLAYINGFQGNKGNYLLNEYVRLTNWSIYSDLFNFAVYLTTMTGVRYFDGDGFFPGMPNLTLCNGVPFIDADALMYHATMYEPDFHQRCYALTGMVQQSGADFIFMQTREDIERLVMGTALAVASIESYLICEKRNEVPDYVFGMTSNNTKIWMEKRRRIYQMNFDGYITYSADMFDRSDCTQYDGILKYIVPLTVPADTYARTNLVLNNAQINKYNNVLDWVNLFTTELSGSTYRVSNLDEKALSDVGAIIERDEDTVYLTLKDWSADRFDRMTMTQNETFGRTALTVGSWRELDINSKRNTGQSRPIKYWEPRWEMSWFCWNADISRGANIIQRSMWPDKVFNKNGTGDTWTKPGIRVLDYVVPTTVWDQDNHQPLTIKYAKAVIQELVPYIVTRNVISNQFKIESDYINREPLSEFKK